MTFTRQSNFQNVIIRFITVLLCFVSYSALGQSLSNNRTYIQKQGLAAQGEETNIKAFSALANSLNIVKGGASYDLAATTVHFFLLTGKKTENVSIIKNGITYAGIRDRYNGIDIYILNRAAINFDTLKTMANDYLSSLQSSPLTLRIKREFFLTKNKEINEENPLPVVSFLINGDARMIPYGDKNGIVSVGGSGHGYFTLNCMFSLFTISPDGTVIDKGKLYFQPSFGLAYGNNEMMETVFTNGENKILLSSELRMGYNSEGDQSKDFGLLVRYTWEDISGPKFRIGATLGIAK